MINTVICARLVSGAIRVPDAVPSGFVGSLLTSAEILWPSAKTPASPLIPSYKGR